MFLPSVTQILSPFSGIENLKLRYPDRLIAAAKRGTLVHSYCESLVQGFPALDIRPDLQGYVTSFKLWLNQVERIHCTELRLIDLNLGFHGQFDLVCQLKGDSYLSLWDIKTPEAAQKTWPLQVAAYRHLAKVNALPTARGGTIRLRKNGQLPIVLDYAKTAQHDWALFVSCLNVYNKFYTPKSTKLENSHVS